MWTSNRPPLPTHVTSTVGARLTLPASTSEEAVRGSGLQLRILRAPTIALLQDLVSRELRAHAMSLVGESKSAKKRAESAALSGVAAQVIQALDAGDFRAAVVAHATGFGLGIDLPPQLGGGIGDVLVIPPKNKRKVILEDTPDAEASDDETVPAAA